MVSFLPKSVLKENRAQWWFVKFAVILVVFVFALFYYSFVPAQQLQNEKGVKSTPVARSVYAVQTHSDNFGTISFEPLALRNTNFNETNDSEDDEEFEDCLISQVPLYDKCSFIYANSGCKNNKYLILLYCYLAPPHFQWLFWIGAIFWIFNLFFLLGDTANTFFSPSLIKLSSYLRLSPNVAGVTLLALGNGAPDLSSIIVGLFKGSAGVGVGKANYLVPSHLFLSFSYWCWCLCYNCCHGFSYTAC
jgi:sodium/potassium/calcium exchanger 6